MAFSAVLVPVVVAGVAWILLAGGPEPTAGPATPAVDPGLPLAGGAVLLGGLVTRVGVLLVAGSVSNPATGSRGRYPFRIETE